MKGQIFPWRALRSSVLETQAQTISFTGNTEHSMPAPDTHFHQKLQLKHPTIDICAHVNSIRCSLTIITLLCYITLFTSLLIDTVNIVLSLLDFTQLVKL